MQTPTEDRYITVQLREQDAKKIVREGLRVPLNAHDAIRAELRKLPRFYSTELIDTIVVYEPNGSPVASFHKEWCVDAARHAAQLVHELNR